MTTAPEREALKALIIGAVESIAPPYAENRREGYDWMRDAVIRKIDAVFKVKAAAPAVMVTEEMVERATTELLAHAICTDACDTENKRLMHIAARAALEAALKSTTPQTGSQK